MQPRLFDLDFMLMTDTILSIIAVIVLFSFMVLSILGVVLLIRFIKKELKR